MKTTISLLAAALMLTITSSSFAQLTSNPLEPGLYDFMKSRTNVSLIDDNHMKVAASEVAWISAEQITITATVAKVTDQAKAEKMIAFFNESSSVGTLAIENGSIVMTHSVNPKLVKQSEIAQVVAMFNSEAARQAVKFGQPIASK
jgi:hypothetical protein